MANHVVIERNAVSRLENVVVHAWLVLLFAGGGVW